MVDYGVTQSTVKPQEIEILDTKVFVSSDIEEVSSDDFAGYEYNLVEYSKDEYIKLQAEQNNSLSNQVTDTQLALIEVYEKMIGG